MALAIYSTATGRLRRVIKNSLGENRTNIQLEVIHFAFTGETSLRVRNNQNISSIERSVKTASGITPANDRYAVIDLNGDIVNIIIADPLCNDSVEGHTLVANENARIGWRQMRNGSFQRSLAEINYDILTQEAKKVRVSRITRRTRIEADIITATNISEATAALIPLQIEKIARLAVR